LKNNENTICEKWEKLNDNKSAPKKRKRIREGKDSEVDKATNEWFSAVTKCDFCMSGPILQQKAEFLLKKLDMVI
jgi:hypothetical protein